MIGLVQTYVGASLRNVDVFTNMDSYISKINVSILA